MNQRMYDHLAGLARDGRLASYSDVAPLIGLSMDHEADREAISEILGEILEHEVRAGRPLLTALVVHSGDDNNPGEGFFRTASDLGRFQYARDPLTRLEFWVGAVNKVHNYWSSASSAGCPGQN